MADPKFRNLMYGMLIISLFAIVFISLQSQFAGHYGQDYAESSTLAGAERLSEINTELQTIENRTMSIQGGSGITDLLGSIFSNGYSVLKLAGGTFGYFTEMVQSSTSEFEFQNSGYFVSVVTSLVLVAIIIGIFLSVLVKREI